MSIEQRLKDNIRELALSGDPGDAKAALKMKATLKELQSERSVKKQVVLELLSKHPHEKSSQKGHGNWSRGGATRTPEKAEKKPARSLIDEIDFINDWNDYVVERYANGSFKEMRDELRGRDAQLLGANGPLDEEQIAAAEFYGNWGPSINGWYRGGSLSDVESETGFGSEIIQQRTETLERLSAQPLKDETVVFRGLDLEDLGDPKSLVGKTFTEPGFLSTTISPSIVSSFMFDERDATGVFMELRAPKGMGAGYLEGTTGYRGEYEVLFGPGTKVVVERVTRVKKVGFLENPVYIVEGRLE